MKPAKKKIARRKIAAKPNARTAPRARTVLSELLVSGGARLIDLTQTLSPDFPTIVLPPEFGQCRPFRMEEVSRYDERGPGWYWNNVSFGEHSGTHFDAPIHWISGRDLPNNSVDTLPVADFIAPACRLGRRLAALINGGNIAARMCMGREPPMVLRYRKTAGR